MVGPVSSDDRDAFLRRAKVGFVVLVGVSAGLITLQGSGEPTVIAGSILAGLVVGAALTRFAFPDTDRFRGRSDEPAADSSGHLERRFESERGDERQRERRNR